AIYYQLLDGIGNPDLKPFRTVQTTLGVERQIIDELSVDVEGFYKYWDDRIVSTGGGAPPRFQNTGIGRAYGLELLGQLRLTAKSQAFLAYALSRTERKDAKDDGSWRLFDADQTHNLSLTANYDLGKGWVAGARFRYVTGNPTTPVVGSVYDASTDTYRAIYGAVNSERHSAFHQLDVRLEKL